MTIKFECPNCHKSLSVKAEDAGKKGRCVCGTIVNVPLNSTLPQNEKIQLHQPTDSYNSECQNTEIFVNKKRFDDFEYFLKLNKNENVCFFAKSLTAGIYLTVTNKRIISIAKNRKGVLSYDSIMIDSIQDIKLSKKFLTNKIEVVVSEYITTIDSNYNQRERSLSFEFAADVPHEKLKEVIDYIRSRRGEFKELKTSILNPVRERKVKSQSSNHTETNTYHTNFCGSYKPGFIDKKKLECFEPFLKLEKEESLYFFAKSVTAGIHLAVTSKRIISIAKNRKGVTHHESVRIDDISHAALCKKILTNKVGIVVRQRDNCERLLCFEFDSASEPIEMIEYIKKVKGGFKESEYSIEDIKRRIEQHGQTFSLNYIGGHPDRTKNCDSGTLVLEDDKLLFISAFKKEVLFVIDYKEIINIQKYTEGEIKKKYSVGKAIAGGVLFGVFGAAGGFMLGKENDMRKFFLTVNAKYIGQRIEVVFSGSDKKIQRSLYTINAALVRYQSRTVSVVPKNHKDSICVADRIRELAQLEKEGLVTKEEFEAKKKQILDL